MPWTDTADASVTLAEFLPHMVVTPLAARWRCWSRGWVGVSSQETLKSSQLLPRYRRGREGTRRSTPECRGQHRGTDYYPYPALCGLCRPLGAYHGTRQPLARRPPARAPRMAQTDRQISSDLDFLRATARWRATEIFWAWKASHNTTSEPSRLDAVQDMRNAGWKWKPLS